MQIKQSEKKSIYTTQFWMICVSSFLFFTSFNMIIPELPDYLTSLGGEDYKGWIIALFTLMAGLSRPFSGKLTDKVGRIPVMVFGVLTCCVCSVLYPLVGTVGGFLLLRFFHGFSTGFKPTGTSAYLADVVPATRRGEAMGILGLFGSSGIGAGPAIGGYLTTYIGIDWMFYASAICALLSILILFGIKETLAKPESFRLSHLKLSASEIWDKYTIPPAIVMLFTITSYGVVLTIIPDHSKALGIENKGLFYVFFTGASVAIRVFAGKASDIYGRIIVLKVSSVVIALALLFIGLSTSPYEFFASAVLLGLGAGMHSPTIFAWTVDRSHPDYRGRAIAMVYIALEIGIGVGALGAAWIYDNQVAYLSYPYYISAVGCVIGLLYLLVFGKKLELEEQNMRRGNY